MILSREQRTPTNAPTVNAQRSRFLRRLRKCMAIAVVLVCLTFSACGGEGELVRQDYNAVIAPERCGGVSPVSCAGYQLTPTPTAAP